MNKPTPAGRRSLSSYLTPPHPCGYLTGRYATNQFLDPELSVDTASYSQLIGLGFRRSGDYVYRPRCFDCDACIPVRIPVNLFEPNRSQRRNLRTNSSLEVIARAPVFDEEHFALYRRYLAWRHEGGGMDVPSPSDYMGFLTSRRLNTRFYEVRDGKILAAVAVVDCLVHSLSSVYTFYEPQYTQRGIGVYTILWQIIEARRLGLSWVYIGYWINECSKMRYKGQYRPLEIYRRGRWLLIDKS